MIHDAKVEVTCDRDDCRESVWYAPEFVYRSMSGAGGHYKIEDGLIEKWLVKDEEWVVRDGKHYCCEACVPR